MCTPDTLLAIASLATSVAGAGASIAGQQQAAAYAGARTKYTNAILANQQIAIQQDVRAETEAELLRQQLLAETGSVRAGEIRVAQAGLGQLVDVGSARDTTEDLAAEVAYKKLISSHQSALRKRDLQIAAADIQGQTSLNILRGEAEQRAARFKQVGTVLTTGSKLTRRFTIEDGALAFRST
jgi:hypothetical protein